MLPRIDGIFVDALGAQVAAGASEPQHVQVACAEDACVAEAWALEEALAAAVRYVGPRLLAVTAGSAAGALVGIHQQNSSSPNDTTGSPHGDALVDEAKRPAPADIGWGSGGGSGSHKPSAGGRPSTTRDELIDAGTDAGWSPEDAGHIADIIKGWDR